jgi:hypothetical protein
MHAVSGTLIALQIVAAALVTVPAVLLLGACAAWVPVLGTLATAFVVLRWHGARHPRWLTRDRVRQLSVHSGLVHAALGAVTYGLAYTAAPATFDLPPAAVLLLAPILGAGAGLVALVVTLCAGDAAAHSLGSWTEGA